MPGSDPPPLLCVDLDGTLVSTDTLDECLLCMARHRPLWLLMLPVWLLGGKAYFKDRVAALGTIDGIVVCQGFLADQEQAAADWPLAERMITVNYTSAVSLVNRFAAYLSARGGGYICGISSVAGDRGRQSNFLYGSTKAAFSTYLDGLRNRLHRRGVAVITVKPGFVDTSMTWGLLNPRSPLVAAPERVARDVARAIRQRKNVVYTPWFWAWIMRIIRLIPEPIFKRLSLSRGADQGRFMTHASPSTHQPLESRREFTALTSLRFFAALAIVLYHAFEVADAESSTAHRAPLSALVRAHLAALRNAPLAVDFFFILSGFVLAHVYFDALAAGEFDYRRFIKRRLARIYPLHLVTALACLALFAGASLIELGVQDPRMFSAPSTAANLLMVHAWGAIDHLSLNGPSWAVSAEWAAYLVFPLLAIAVLRSPLGSVTTLAATLLVFAAAYWLGAARPLTERTFDYGTLRIAAEFPIGLALYRLFRERPTWLAQPAIAWATIAWGTIVLVLAAMQLQVEQGLVVPLFAVLIYSCAAAECAGGLRGLRHPWLVYGGTISYSIYLVHAPLLACGRAAATLVGLPPASLLADAWLVATIVAVIPASIASYAWIERPANRWTFRMLNTYGLLR